MFTTRTRVICVLLAAMLFWITASTFAGDGHGDTIDLDFLDWGPWLVLLLLVSSAAGVVIGNLFIDGCSPTP